MIGRTVPASGKEDTTGAFLESVIGDGKETDVNMLYNVFLVFDSRSA